MLPPHYTNPRTGRVTIHYRLVPPTHDDPCLFIRHDAVLMLLRGQLNQPVSTLHAFRRMQAYSPII